LGAGELENKRKNELYILSILNSIYVSYTSLKELPNPLGVTKNGEERNSA
jgi:hypothetical protein